MKNLSGILAGVAGEYFVAAELSRRGYIASITLRNSKGVDILCSNADATKTVGIQVKTSSGTGPHWLLNEKAEQYFDKNLFYVFVNLNLNKRPPSFFIVPSRTVATYIKKNHQRWLRTPGRHGQKHKDSSMRQFKDSREQYLNRWTLLGLNRGRE